MKSWIITLILSATVGFAVGNLTKSQATEVGSSNLSSYNGTKDTALLYQCPTQTEFATLTQSVNFKGEFTHNCANTKMSKFGRVLKFISQAKANLPAKWTAARDVLENPFAYVQRNSRSTQVDLNQRTTIAFNRERGDIFLGGRFFTNDILDSALSLLHESRHSEPFDPGHTTCRWGDVAGATGGCDLKFAIDNTAGAYSYQVLIGVAWAKYLPNLTQGQREYLLSVALTRLAARFNIVPPSLAVPVEQLWALDEDGKIYPVSQLTGQLGPALAAPSTYKRIEFFPVNNGLVALNGKSAYVFKASGAPVSDYFAFKKVASTDAIRDVALMSNRRGEAQDPFEYMITTNNVLKFIDTDVTTGERFVNESEHQPKNFGFNLLRLTHARRKRYALTDDRKVVFLDDDAVKITESTFSDPNGFRQLEGGLFYSSLFGVNTKGVIKYWNDKTNQTIDSGTQFSAPVKKLAYSVSFTAALLDDNKIEIRLLNLQPKLLQVKHPKRIIDIAVTRGFQLNHALFGSTELASTLKEAATSCSFVRAYPGVWSADIVGITRTGEVFTWSPRTKRCVAADFSRYGIRNAGITSIDLMGTSYGATAQLMYPTVVLKKADGTTSSFVPYNFK